MVIILVLVVVAWILLMELLHIIKHGPFHPAFAILIYILFKPALYVLAFIAAYGTYHLFRGPVVSVSTAGWWTTNSYAYEGTAAWLGWIVMMSIVLGVRYMAYKAMKLQRNGFLLLGELALLFVSTAVYILFMAFE